MAFVLTEIFNVVPDFLGHSFTLIDYGNSGGIGSDHFSGYAADALLPGAGFLFCEVCLTGAAYVFRLSGQGSRLLKRSSVRKALCNICHCGDQAVQIFLFVGVGDDGNNIAVVGKLYVDVIFVKEHLLESKACNADLCCTDDHSGFIDGGVKISAFGACSRTKSIKSVCVKANKAHGNNKFDCQIFREKPALKWKGIVLRNSGNDFGRMLFRDGYIQSVAASGMDLDHQAYEPTVVFMNGEYYAMLGMRERTNKDFVYSNYGLDEEDFCIHVISKTSPYS